MRELPNCADAAIRLSITYVDAMKKAVPALAEIFEPSIPEQINKSLEERSTDDLIIEVDKGRFLGDVAQLWGVGTTELNRWITSDIERLQQFQFARRNQAALWDWVAFQVLLHAPSDRVEIVRAEKIAQHCRWRAAAISRDDYGQKTRLARVEDFNTRELTTRELQIIARGGVEPSMTAPHES